MNLITKTGILVVSYVALTATAQSCADSDMNDVVNNARWCKNECESGRSGMENQCAGYSRMKPGAESSDANAIREGFEFCHTDNGGVKNQMNDCYNSRRDEFLSRIRIEVFNLHPAPPPAPPPPCNPTEVITRKFDVEMIPDLGTVDRRDVVGAIEVDVPGELRGILPVFYRDDELIRTMGLRSLSAKPNASTTAVVIASYDVKNDNSELFRYRVKGTLDLEIKKVCP